MTYERHSRSLEMRACRLAVIETLERLTGHADAHKIVPTSVVSDIAKAACEAAAAGTNSLAPVVVDTDCEEISHCIVCRDPDNRGCCEYGRAA
jgi:hypothetical protein